MAEIFPMDLQIQIPLLDQTPIEAAKDEIEEGRDVDHSIVRLNETNGQLGFQTNISTNEIFDERFKDMGYLSAKSTTIFKVNVGLRESNPAAYTPKLISIGPFYHNKSANLCSMEKYKYLYLQRFLDRNEKIDVESCMRELEKLKDKALMCYDDIENLDEDIVGKFSKIMLLDGCFLVEFIRERFGIRPRKVERYQRVIDKAWMIHQVSRDMVVLENQLPFFVLTMLHDMTKCPTEESFLYMVKHTLLNVFPKKTYIPKSEIDGINAERFDHLLHVVHVLSCPSDMIKSRQCSNVSTKNGFCNIMESSKEIRDILNIWHNNHVPSATELHEAGVSFTKKGRVDADGMDTTTLLDIKFENGLMEIPCFAVDDSAETFLRNLIAFEQHSSNTIPYFSDYADIMNRLINSRKDVHLLRESGIILNYLGDDKAVANIFNKLGDGVAPPGDFYYYKEECSKLNQHCQKPWNKMMANLRHNYFQSPWAGVSTVGAIMLLTLSTIQTVLSFTGGVK